MLCSCSSSDVFIPEVSEINPNIEMTVSSDISEVTIPVTNLDSESHDSFEDRSRINPTNCNVLLNSDIADGNTPWCKVRSNELGTGNFTYAAGDYVDANGYWYELGYDENFDTQTLYVYDIENMTLVGSIEFSEDDLVEVDASSCTIEVFGNNQESYILFSEYNYDYSYGGFGGVDNVVCSLNTDDFTLGDEVELALSDGEVSVYQTDNQTCFAEVFSDEDYNPEGCNLYLYDDLNNDPITIDFSALTGDVVTYVNNVANLDNGDIVVSYFDGDYETKIAAINSEGTELSEVPEYIDNTVEFINIDGQLVLKDASGIFVVDNNEPVRIMDIGLVKESYVGLFDSRIVEINDTGIKLISYDYDIDTITYLDELIFVDFPYEGRERILIGCPSYIPDNLQNQISKFNAGNEEYYAQFVVVSDKGVDPIIGRDAIDSRVEDILANISLEDFGDMDYAMMVVRECAFSMELKEFISGPDAPDVIATDGLWGQLNEPGLFNDISDIYNQLDEDEYFTNIFDATSSVGNCFVPVFYNLSGIMTYNNEPSYEYSLDVVVNDETTGLTYNAYQTLVNEEWGGVDPMFTSCNPGEYMEELISLQYDLYVDRENQTVSFADNSNFDQLVYYITYSVQPDYTDSEYSDNSFYGGYFTLLDFVYYDEESILYPLPSSDNRGVAIEPILCLGIPATAQNQDGAEEFILYSLSLEGQLLPDVDEWGIPVNRIAVDEVIESSYFGSAPVDVASIVGTATNLYVADAEIRCACLGPIALLEASQNNTTDYTADEIAELIENNMEYFLQED